MQTTEQRLERLEKRNRRLTAALTLMVVAMCAVVTMAATGENYGVFDVVKARRIWVTNDAGKIVVTLDANDGGDGLVFTQSAKGKDLVTLNSTPYGDGTVTTFQPNGKELVGLTADDSGGMINVYNNTGEGIAQMYADEYGNGLVGAYNRKGEGRTLTPGP